MTLTVRRAESPDDVEDAFDVRRDVFIDEQNVDEALEMDGKDDEAVHFVAYDDGRPVGTARLRTVDGASEVGQDGGATDEDGRESETICGEAGNGGGDAEKGGCGAGGDDGEENGRDGEKTVGKVERVAVRRPVRGTGVGRAIMETLESWATDQGIDRLKLHAQTRVEEFYAKLGYETTSDVFQEAGIDHVAMEKTLAARPEENARLGADTDKEYRSEGATDRDSSPGRESDSD